MATTGTSFPLWAWFVFGAALLACLAIDLILHGGARRRSHAAAITCTALWVGVGVWPSLRAVSRLAHQHVEVGS